MNFRNYFCCLLVISFSLTISSCVSYERTSYSKSKSTKSAGKKTNASKSKTSSKKGSTASKKSNISTTKTITLKSNNTKASKSSEVKSVINEAEKYKGTPYKYGGTSSNGMDCSGLVCVAFQKIDKKLPRRSIDMSSEGSSVNVSNVKEGDLLFFATGGGSINHVGIVHSLNSSGEIFFIHASTSKGVTISSLEEKYWKGKFVKARRVL